MRLTKNCSCVLRGRNVPTFVAVIMGYCQYTLQYAYEVHCLDTKTYKLVLQLEKI